jgi:hypothetical protein
MREQLSVPADTWTLGRPWEHCVARFDYSVSLVSDITRRRRAAIQLSQRTQRLPDLQAQPCRQLLLARVSLPDSQICSLTISRGRQSG